MAWPDWLKYEVDVLEEEINSVINDVYHRMFHEFNTTHQKRVDEIRRSDSDGRDKIEMLQWCGAVRDTQQQMLTAMILAVTYRSIEDLLRRFLTYFFPAFMPEPNVKRIKGMSQLDVMAVKYEAIGIKLGDRQEYEVIREIRHARNACVHSNNVPPKTYRREFPNPRWLDVSDRISIDVNQWTELVADLSKWAKELRSGLDAARASIKAAQTGQPAP